MARFRFRLQTVLEHKQRLEELAQVELAKAQAAQLKEEGVLQQLTAAETAAVAELERQRFTGKLDIEALQLGLGYMDVLKAQIQRQTQVVFRVRQQTEGKRQELVARMQERKTLEQLRQRQLDAFTLEQNRIEAREADDLVVMRHVHQQVMRRAQSPEATVPTR